MSEQRNIVHEWGPKDNSWTVKKSKAHSTYCRKHKTTLTWEEYRKRIKDGEAARKQANINRLSSLDPSKIRMGGRKVLMRPAADIVAKILSKVS